MRLRLMATITVVLGTILTSCSAASPRPVSSDRPVEQPAPSAPLRLTILHSNDTWGYLLPCG